MYFKRKIGVIVPAHNEENFILGVVGSMPDYVDRIYVVNDASTDRTLELVSGEVVRNSKLALINRQARGGVGAAIFTGHSEALKDGIDVMVVMAGDGQMDPAHLNRFIEPIINGKADYVKGNRLSNHQDIKEMPMGRIVGNFLLTNLTRVASGYWNISDPQNGYTAISANTLRKLDMDKIEHGFAFENDMLVKLNAAGARVIDIQHPAIYRGQNSKIRYPGFIVRTSWVLFKDTFWRIWVKYLVNHRDRNPDDELAENEIEIK
ncbi:MAG: glycosyltransferase family 2 protein [Dehalococcoidales bacterium]|nr:glycosyltransferase family 2 protein [Dehalococcoidales bacterium]